jgi:choline dehydrogenase-like flavoprotein
LRNIHFPLQLASKDEYDAIASLGNCGWDYNSLLPYFKQAENYTAQIGNPIFPGAGNITSDKGTNGPVIVSISQHNAILY